MGLLLQIAALLAAAAATSASDLPCAYQEAENRDKQLVCSGRQLTAPPAGVWPDVSSLYLDRNPITTFATNAFTGFPNVSYFHAANTSLVEIDMGDFVVMSQLDYLSLDNNYIKKVIAAPEGTVFENLRVVSLDGNSITTLDPDFLYNAPNIKGLSVEDNPIIVMSGQPIINHDSLASLYFGRGMNLADADIAALLSGVPELEYLGMRHAHVNDISGGNDISGAFVNLNKLKQVYLQYNDITQLTSGTFAPEAIIDELNLMGNPLKRLDTAGVNKAMAKGGLITIEDTPVACQCAYEGLFWWADAKGVVLRADCGGQALCGYTRRRSLFPSLHR